MAKFRYTVADPQSASRSGEIEAASLAAARAELELAGLTVSELVEVHDKPAALSGEEAGELAGHVARIGSAGLPLASGLRAAAAECGQHRVAALLCRIADRIDEGQTLESVVDGSPELFPQHVGSLIVAAGRTGKLGSALAELLEHQRGARALRQTIARGFAYPAFVACLAAIILGCIVFLVSGTYRRMFAEFGLQLPLQTRLLFWWQDYGGWLIAGAAIALVGAAAVSRLTLGPVRWMRLIANLPIVGPLSYWSGLAEWCSLLSVLLKHRIALPDALRLSADGVQNAYVGQLSRTLAEQSAAGQTLSQLLTAGRRLPGSLVPLIRWGEKIDLLHEAFSAGKELFDRRVRIRAIMLHSILPPMLFIAIATAIGLVVVALFGPLFYLIQGLS